MESLLASILDRGARTTLLRELDARGDAMLAAIGRHPDVLKKVENLVDEDFAPVLVRYASAGADNVLETLSQLALRIPGPVADRLIDLLFQRCAFRLAQRARNQRRVQQSELARAVHSLIKHPRFSAIPHIATKLEELMRLSLPDYETRAVLTAFASHPRAYITLEELLLRTVVFEHYHEDQVDRLDDAADRLFASTTA